MTSNAVYALTQQRSHLRQRKRVELKLFAALALDTLTIPEMDVVKWKIRAAFVKQNKGRYTLYSVPILSVGSVVMRVSV